MTELDEFIDRAGDNPIIMVSIPAFESLMRHAQAGTWSFDGPRAFYRGALIEPHEEWSWGWMVRRADGSIVEAEKVK